MKNVVSLLLTLLMLFSLPLIALAQGESSSMDTHIIAYGNGTADSIQTTGDLGDAAVAAWKNPTLPEEPQYDEDWKEIEVLPSTHSYGQLDDQHFFIVRFEPNEIPGIDLSATSTWRPYVTYSLNFQTDSEAELSGYVGQYNVVQMWGQTQTMTQWVPLQDVEDSGVPMYSANSAIFVASKNSDPKAFSNNQNSGSYANTTLYARGLTIGFALPTGITVAEDTTVTVTLAMTNSVTNEQSSVSASYTFEAPKQNVKQAKIGETEYDTLEDAIDAATGENPVITLLTDVTGNYTIEKSLEINSGDGEAKSINGSITIGDSAVVALSNITVSNGIIVSGASAEATLTSVNVGSNGVEISGENAKVALDTSTISGMVRVSGASANVTIQNTTVSNTTYCLRVDSGSATVTGSTLKGTTAIYIAKGATVTVNGEVQGIVYNAGTLVVGSADTSFQKKPVSGTDSEVKLPEGYETLNKVEIEGDANTKTTVYKPAQPSEDESGAASDPKANVTAQTFKVTVYASGDESDYEVKTVADGQSITVGTPPKNLEAKDFSYFEITDTEGKSYKVPKSSCTMTENFNNLAAAFIYTFYPDKDVTVRAIYGSAEEVSVPSTNAISLRMYRGKTPGTAYDSIVMAASYSGAEISYIGVVYSTDPSQTLDGLRSKANNAVMSGSEINTGMTRVKFSSAKGYNSNYVYHLTIGDNTEANVKAIGFVQLSETDGSTYENILTTQMLDLSYSDLTETKTVGNVQS